MAKYFNIYTLTQADINRSFQRFVLFLINLSSPEQGKRTKHFINPRNELIWTGAVLNILVPAPTIVDMSEEYLYGRDGFPASLTSKSKQLVLYGSCSFIALYEDSYSVVCVCCKLGSCNIRWRHFGHSSRLFFCISVWLIWAIVAFCSYHLLVKYITIFYWTINHQEVILRYEKNSISTEFISKMEDGSEPVKSEVQLMSNRFQGSLKKKSVTITRQVKGFDYIIKSNSKLNQAPSWRLWGWWRSGRTGRRWARWGTEKTCSFYIFLSDEMLKRLKVEVHKKTRSRWDLTFDKILMTFPVEDIWRYDNDKNDDNEDEEEVGTHLWQDPYDFPCR